MKKPTHTPNGILAIFATLLIVGGVVMVAYVASQTKMAPTGTPRAVSPLPLSATSTSQAFLIVDGSEARIRIGTFERKCAWPDDVTLLGQPVSTLVGRELGTGRTRVLDAQFKLADPSTLRSPDGRRELRRAAPRSDGVGAIEIMYGSESEPIVIRGKDGTPIRSVIPIGWWDAETAAVTGVATSTRALYAVALMGSVTHVADLPDAYEYLEMMHGSAYIITVTPGEGLESPGAPPSSLVRVARSGDVQIAATEPEAIIDRLVADSTGRVAYRKTSAVGTIMSTGGDPLFVLPDSTVVTTQDPVFSTIQAEAVVFYLPNAKLDEIRPNP